MRAVHPGALLLVWGLLNAGCASTDPAPSLAFQATPTFEFTSSGAPGSRALPGRLGVIPIVDRRTLPFHGGRRQGDEDFFEEPAVEALRGALVDTLKASGLAEDVVRVPSGESLIDPDAKRLRTFAREHPDLDFVLAAEVDLLNLTTRSLGTGEASSGGVVYKDISYFAHRLHLRAHVEIYSLAYGKLVWSDVLEAFAFAGEHRDAFQELLDHAFVRFCETFHASFEASALVVSREGDALEFSLPDERDLVELTVERNRARAEWFSEDVSQAHLAGAESIEKVAAHEASIRKQEIQSEIMANQLLTVLGQAEEGEQQRKTLEQLEANIADLEERLQEIEQAEGSTVLSTDPDVIEQTAGFDFDVPEPTPGRERNILGEFVHYEEPGFHVLSQVDEVRTRQIMGMTRRILAAFEKEYAARKLSLATNPFALFVLEDQDSFDTWCGEFRQPGAGGFYQVIRADDDSKPESRLRRAMDAVPSLRDVEPVIGLYWRYQAHQEEPVSDLDVRLAGIDAMWTFLPHEIAHHVHRVLLGGAVPPFQADGFATYHEYPVTAYGDVRFGDFDNPGNAAWLEYLRKDGIEESLIPLSEIIGMSYPQVSGGGSNYRGYASAWLYYQYFRRKRAAELLEFEKEFASRPPEARGPQGIRSTFLSAFDSGLDTLGAEARSWAEAQTVSKEKRDEVQNVIEALKRQIAVSFSLRRELPQVLAE